MRTSPARSRPAFAASTSCAAMSRTSTTGARSTSPSAAYLFDEGSDMSTARRLNPCLDTVARPVSAGDRRIRVVEVLATGTNGGAQEHLYGLVTRIDKTRYDVSIVALSPGSAVRKLQRAGFDVLVIDEPDDAIAVVL